MDPRTPTDIWPFFGLTVTTPRLTLVYPTDELIAELVAVADDGIHDPQRSPFVSTWSMEPPEQRVLSMLQFHWSSRASLEPDDWKVPFAVIVDGEVVGSQDAFARKFPKTRTVTTGSWLGQAHQGCGIGTEMRSAILHLLFEGFGAEVAQTEAFASNPASIGVTEKLGYQPNGEGAEVRSDGAVDRSLRYRLTRAEWEANRRDDITINGLEPCLPLMGL